VCDLETTKIVVNEDGSKVHKRAIAPREREREREKKRFSEIVFTYKF